MWIHCGIHVPPANFLSTPDCAASACGLDIIELAACCTLPNELA
jgi:hypothetical protein